MNCNGGLEPSHSSGKKRFYPKVDYAISVCSIHDLPVLAILDQLESSRTIPSRPLSVEKFGTFVGGR